MYTREMIKQLPKIKSPTEIRKIYYEQCHDQLLRVIKDIPDHKVYEIDSIICCFNVH